MLFCVYAEEHLSYLERGIAMKDICSKDFEVFNVNDKFYIYVCNTGKIYESDKETIDVLQNNHIEKLGTSQISEDAGIKKALKDIEENNIFEDITTRREKIAEARIKTDDFAMISLLIIQKCNLRCTYCYGENGQYQDSGIMDFDTAKRAIDYFIQNTSKKHLTVCFFGGEPLMNFGLIKQVVEYCQQITANIEKEINFTMTTNGILINAEIEKFIVDNKINVQISLDGDRDTQNKNRFDANKKGSYDTVIDKTKSLRQQGRLGVRATLTPFNFNVTSIYKHLDSLKFRQIIISPAFNMLSDDDYEILSEKYVEWYDYLKSEIHKKNYEYVKKAKQFIQELKKVDRALVRTVACGVGKNLLAIDIHGNIFPCQRFVAMKEYCIGNIKDGMTTQKQFLEEVNKPINEKCQKCWCRNLCVSGCSYCNVESTGDVKKAEEAYCRYVRKTTSAIIKIYLELNEEDKKMLF